MTTLILKVNEKTKAGKTFLSMVDFFLTEKEGIEVVENPNKVTQKAMHEAENKIGLTKTKNTKDLFEKLGI